MVYTVGCQNFRGCYMCQLAGQEKSWLVFSCLFSPVSSKLSTNLKIFVFWQFHKIFVDYKGIIVINFIIIIHIKFERHLAE